MIPLVIAKKKKEISYELIIENIVQNVGTHF